MKSLKLFLWGIVGGCLLLIPHGLSLAPPAAQAQTDPSPITAGLDPENLIYMELPYGRVTIQMLPDLAPQHVTRIRQLIRQGFYDGVVFHRVIAGFVAQTGDPTGTGRGGSGQSLPAEFNSAPHLRGSVSMARAQDPDSADSQFFICLDDARHLDGQYTLWGKVIEGMEFVDAIKKGNHQANGLVSNPDQILSMHIATDVRP